MNTPHVHNPNLRFGMSLLEATESKAVSSLIGGG
jgi:hypothetical protein